MPDLSQHIVIIGGGVFGLSSALHLLDAGFSDITILDKTDHEKTKYNPFHGSDSASGDINKLFRTYYEDKTLYSKLAAEALPTWEKWNDDVHCLPQEDKERFLDADLELVRLTGAARLNDTPKLSAVELRNLEGFTELGLRETQYDINSPRDLARAKLVGLSRKMAFIDDWKERGIVAHLTGTYDSVGRLLKADKACYYVKILLEKRGVKFVFGDDGNVVEIVRGSSDAAGTTANRSSDGEEAFSRHDTSTGDKISVGNKTSTGNKATAVKVASGMTYPLDTLVVSAGPWSTSLLPQELEHRIMACLANVAYLQIPKSRPDLIAKYANYPQIQWRTASSGPEQKHEGRYGKNGFAFFPNTITEGILKVNTRQTKFWNPVKIGDRYISVPETLGEEKLPKLVLQEVKDILLAIAPDVAVLPDAKLISKRFWYTDSINSDFVIDWVPQYDNVILATGGSAHGYKFLPVLGRTVVDRFFGRENEYTHLFRWKHPEEINVDTSGLREEHIEARRDRVLSGAVLLDEEDLVFSEEDLKKIGKVVLE